ncbi:heat-shock protein [Geothrix limicola]|uniref:Heat-shock protein n=1 Tax=Geothrix limicola TaxID=2927978 RepID=A0ABQ5QDY0_9BACT|nr:Hsp20/alpha crystallin family protein [Geothrix limicola]GLH72867.1 heat-shock protein [Geothrix limicola]
MKSGDPRTWMWTRALEALNEAERLHKQFFHLGRSPSRRPVWEPPVDIFEGDGALHIVVALPGVTLDRLKVVSEGTSLLISGDLPVPWEGRIGALHRMEIPHGRFERRIEGLPPGLQATRHALCDGCLFLSFRKPEHP